MQADPTFGTVLLCDQTGVILETLYNELDLVESDVLGKSFPQLVHISSFQKALSFMVELRSKGSIFDWELNLLLLDGKTKLTHCAGLALNDKLLIMVAWTHKEVHNLFDKMMYINNEQLNLLRESIKDRVELENVRPETESRHFDEFTKLNNEMLTLQRELTRKNIELEKLNAEVQHIAVTDGLTGLYNRRGFFELSNHEMERIKRFESTFSVIMIDIDHFKRVNDTYGHAVGDQVLKQVAARFHEQVRKVDILGRYGGEEFSILLPETKLAGARNLAERLRCCIADQPIETAKGFMNMTISVGLATLVNSAMTLEEILKQADDALYQAKESGRNRICVHGE